MAFANSFNVLQDKSANDLFGWLGFGTRIGLWARYTNILESHIIGDPTFCFSSGREGMDCNTWLTTSESPGLENKVDSLAQQIAIDRKIDAEEKKGE